MRKKITANLSIAALSIAALYPAAAMAWSEESHMTTGAIAYDDLANSDPAVLSQLEKIILAHPHYLELAAHAGGLTGAERTRVIFEWLARWPDDMNGTQFEHRSWHYELRVVYGWTWLWPFRNGDASEAFDINYRTLSDPNAPDAERAIALAWLIHIVGDIQQPLHAGHQMNGNFYLTDEAGTLAFIRKEVGGGAINLHQYWDKSIDIPGPVDATANTWSGALPNLWPRGKISELTYPGTAPVQFGLWLDESMHLAEKVAYKGTALKATPAASDAPVATPSEFRFVQELSKRRVATAGYRIADTIKMALRPV